MPGLIPFILSIAPEAAGAAFGPQGAALASAAASAIAAVTGADNPDDAQKVISADPTKASELRVRLAQIAAEHDAAARRADADRLAARLADEANARAQTVDLARAGSAAVWGAPVVSVVVLITFAAAMTLSITRAMPPGSESVLNTLLGMLGAGFTAVVQFWLGSSAGSAQKNALLAMSQPATAPASGRV